VRGWPDLPSGATAERRLVVVPTRPGPHRVVLAADSSGGTAAGAATFAVSAPPQSGDDETWRNVLFVAGLAVACAGMWDVRRRRMPRQPGAGG
jgi:hypothetical protein